MKEQLVNIHPEVIMFMSKIRKLSIHEYNEDFAINKVMQSVFHEKPNFKLPRMNTVNHSFYISQHKKMMMQRVNAIIICGGSVFVCRSRVG